MDSLLPIVVATFAAAVFLAVVNANWRNGAYLILLAGFMQDPIRKLVPGEPVAISAAVAVVMLIVWAIGVVRYSGQPEQTSLRHHFPAVAGSLIAFSALVLFQSLITIVTYGSIPLAGIGLIAYLSPLPAIWVGWWFCQTEEDILKLLLSYVAFGFVATVGVYMSWSDVDWAILKQIGEALVIYDPIVGVVETNAGFMRAPEIAAWHMGAASCLLILLAITRPNPARIAAFAIAIAVIIPAIYLTGRRKALAMIGLFAGILTILLQFSTHRDARRAITALAGLAVGVVSIFFYLTEDASEASGFRQYSDRGDSVYADAWDRFYTLGIGSLFNAIDGVGFFGLGAGVVSQGGQYFGVDEELAGAAEGGLGKIVVELGVLGLIILIWVALVIGKAIRELLRTTHTPNRDLSTVMLTMSGLVAFLLVNIVLFVTASQVFGDPFVLILLGIVFGSVLATSRMLLRQRDGNSEGTGRRDIKVEVHEARLRNFGS